MWSMVAFDWTYPILAQPTDHGAGQESATIGSVSMNKKMLVCLAWIIALVGSCCTLAFGQMPITMAVSGAESMVWGDCVFHQRTGNYTCYQIWNYGTVSVIANGKTASANYAQGSTPTTLAQALCAQMTSSFPVHCTGTTGALLNVAETSVSSISVSSVTNVHDPYDDGYPPPETSFGLGLPLVTGFVNPKYKVVGIAYTVPGEQSYVQYTDTTMLGTSTSTSSSFSTNVTTSVSVCGSTGPGVCGSNDGVAVTGTYTNSFTQQSNTSSSYAVNTTTSFVDKWSPLTGPNLDHGNDVVYVWVNPVAWYSYTLTKVPPTTSGPLAWNGYTYDLADDSNNMEVIPLRLSELLNPSTIDSFTLGRLKRVWAQTNTDGSGPGITNQDLLNIAAQDPFSNSTYTITIGSDGKTTTDKRFTQTTNGELYYLPGDNNGYSWLYTTTATQGQGAQTTYQEGFALEEKYQADWFVAGLTYDWKQSTTFTWMDQWNSLMTEMMSQQNLVDIVGPTGSYTGPTEFNIFQDNVYGTFMVYPVPPT
jgi:hypothetical protein